MKKDKSESPCINCKIFTNSIRKGRAYFICEKCNTDKTLSDVFYYEIMNRRENEK